MAKNNNKPSTAKYKRARIQAMKDISKVNKQYNDAATMGFTQAAVLFLWVLHTQFGFGTKRIHQFVMTYQKYIREHTKHEDATEGEYQGITAYDMAQALKDEYDIEIDLHKGSFEIKNLKAEII